MHCLVILPIYWFILLMFIFLDACIENQIWKIWIQKCTKCVVDVEHWWDVENRNLKVIWESLKVWVCGNEKKKEDMTCIWLKFRSKMHKIYEDTFPYKLFLKMKVWFAYKYVKG